MNDLSPVQTATLKELHQDSGHLAALANTSRQKLLMILGQNPTVHGMKVNDLARMIDLSQPATSHHLKQLHELGMVSCRQVGNIVYYYLTLDDTIARLERLTTLLEKRAAN